MSTIVVCVKYVPDATADRHFEADNTVDRDGVDGLLSELDEYAVEEALRIKERPRTARTCVTALTIGPEQAADAVRKALQMGADSGVHVVDDAIAGSDAPPPRWSSPRRSRRRERADLVLCGMASTDGSDECRAGHARRAPRAAAGHDGVRGGLQGDQVRIRRDGDTATEMIGATSRWCCGDRPDRRAALPVVQGDHGGQEEAGGDLVAGRPGGRRRQVGLAAAWIGGRGHRGPPAAPAGEIVTDEDGRRQGAGRVPRRPRSSSEEPNEDRVDG